MNSFQIQRPFLCVFLLLLTLLTLASLVSCGTESETVPASSAVPETTATESAFPALNCTVTVKALPGLVQTHTEKQAGFLSDTTDTVAKYAGGNEEISAPQPITLEWEVAGEESGISHFIVRIWMKTDQSDTKSYRTQSTARSFALDNAYIGERYYWNVTAYGFAGDSVTSRMGTFVTASQAPRNLNLDGVTNVRDLGGWNTADGGRVRQGLLFRGARLNSGKTSLITSAGISTARQKLAIQTEIDLRTADATGGITSSMLGSGVNYFNRPLKKENLYKDADNLAMVKEIFALLADEDNYPIYFHCSIGTDRTGMIAWLIGGLLGVSEDDLWRDFLFSNFGEIQGPRSKDNMQSFVDKVKQTSGSSLSQKVYNYLRNDLSVPTSYLDAVIRIMKIAPGESEIPVLR